MCYLYIIRTYQNIALKIELIWVILITFSTLKFMIVSNFLINLRCPYSVSFFQLHREPIHLGISTEQNYSMHLVALRMPVFLWVFSGFSIDLNHWLLLPWKLGSSGKRLWVQSVSPRALSSGVDLLLIHRLAWSFETNLACLDLLPDLHTKEQGSCWCTHCYRWPIWILLRLSFDHCICKRGNVRIRSRCRLQPCYRFALGLLRTPWSRAPSLCLRFPASSQSLS